MDFEQQLRAAGLRVTKQRVAVLTAVCDNQHAPTATILDDVRRVLPAVSHQAVYDCLSDLTEVGLLRRIQPQGSVALYETRRGDNHHHLVCRDCGLVTDVDCAIDETPCLTPVDGQSFVIDEAEVIYWGLCPACQKRERARSTTAHPR